MRIVRGERGTVRMHTELVVRFEYGSRRSLGRAASADGRLQRVAGPNGPSTLRGAERCDMRTVGEFSVSAGEECRSR